MHWVTQLSIAYALINIGASYGLNMRRWWGPWVGCTGAILGFGVGLPSQDAKGLMLNTPVYFIIGVLAIRSGKWRKETDNDEA